MSRYNSFATLIKAGGYKLADIRERINGIADRGEVTLEERDKLLKLAQEHANPLNETDKSVLLAEHDRRIRKLEERLAALEGGETDVPTDENGDIIIPDYVAGKWYYAGNKVTWQDKVYVCVAPENTPCVWSPTEYPAYWSERT